MAQISKKIYYHDTDAGGVVYYGNYLKYLEEGRTEYLIDKGLILKDLAAKGIWFVVRHLDINYKSPARYSDNLIITSEVVKIKNVSFTFYQEIKRTDTILVTATTQMVCVDSTFHPCAIPEGMFDSIPNENRN